jgi:hypothetical protein
MSLLDTKTEAISPKRIYEICEGCEIAADRMIYVSASPGELAHVFKLALDALAEHAMRARGE